MSARIKNNKYTNQRSNHTYELYHRIIHDAHGQASEGSSVSLTHACAISVKTKDAFAPVLADACSKGTTTEKCPRMSHSNNNEALPCDTLFSKYKIGIKNFQYGVGDLCSHA